MVVVLRSRPLLNGSRPLMALALAVLVGGPGCTLFGPTTARSYMNVVDSSQDANDRYRAFRALGTDQVYDNPGQKHEAATKLLARLDPDVEPLASRAMICRTLGLLGDPVARDAMIRLVRDPDPTLRTEASRALGRVGRPEDATVLMQLMKLDADDNCKVAAIESLGLLKAADPRTKAYLVEAMEHDNPAIRLASLESLRKLSRRDLGVNPGPWRDLVRSEQGRPSGPPTAPGASLDPETMPASGPVENRPIRDGRASPAREMP